MSSLGNTTQSTRQFESIEALLEASSVHIDYFVSAGVLTWTDEESPLRSELAKACDLANQYRVSIPIALNGYRCEVHPGGMGKGRQTHLRYRITCGDITLGLDFRTKASRRFHNFSLTITGRACLLRGALEIRTWVMEILAELGGELVDEWIRRLDVCLDLPGLDPQELLTPCLENRFLSTSSENKINRDGSLPETFTVISNEIYLQIYNKLSEVQSVNYPEKLTVMRDLRWGGTIPQAATRVELRVLRGWFKKWESDQAQTNLDNIGAIVRRLLGEDRPFFRLLETVPDWKNNNQSRCKTLPLWDAICTKMMANHYTELKARKIRWNQMSQNRRFKLIKSHLIQCAVERRQPIRSIADAQAELEQLSYLHDYNDWAWLRDWDSKANNKGLPGKPSDLVGPEDVPF